MPKTPTKFPKTIAAIAELERLNTKGDGARLRFIRALVEETGGPGRHGVNNGTKVKLTLLAAELTRWLQRIQVRVPSTVTCSRRGFPG
jgi:hypothetical protein